MEINQIFVILGLVANVIVLALVAKNFVIVENIFMLRWRGVSVSLLFIVLGFFVWFLAEFLEPSSYSLYLQLLPVSFSLLLLGQICLAFVLLRKQT